MNLHMYTKTEMKNLLRYQGLLIYIACIGAILLTYKTVSPFIAIGNVYMIFGYGYFYHMSCHLFPGIIYIHKYIHHNHNISYFVGLFVQFFVDSLLFLSIYLFNHIIPIPFLSKTVLLYIAILYISTHMLNYSTLHIKNNHVLHHTLYEKDLKECNYGPDLFDHLFGTTCDGTFENMSWIIPNAVFAFLVTYFIVRPSI